MQTSPEILTKKKFVKRRKKVFDAEICFGDSYKLARSSSEHAFLIGICFALFLSHGIRYLISDISIDAWIAGGASILWILLNSFYRRIEFQQAESIMDGRVKDANGSND